MSEWWTYTLSDLLLFSPRTYYRLLELYNLAVWPAQLVAAMIGIAIVVSVARGAHDRLRDGLLALCWLWIAWAFHFRHYAQINWMAPWFASAFAFQALLLVALGVLARRLVFRPASGRERGTAASLVAIVVLGYPLLAPLAGRVWTSAETFGAAPDPTAIATVATMALIGGRMRWLLLVVPLLWCAVAAATLWTMGTPEALVVIAATLLALWPAIRGKRRVLTETTEA